MNLSDHPRVSGGFALDRNLWQGRRVAARVRVHRGHAYRRTVMTTYYGTLDLTAGTADQLGVRVTPRGGGEPFVQIIHRNRVVDLYDLTRRKSPSARP